MKKKTSPEQIKPPYCIGYFSYCKAPCFFKGQYFYPRNFFITFCRSITQDMVKFIRRNLRAFFRALVSAQPNDDPGKAKNKSNAECILPMMPVIINNQWNN